MSPTLTISAPTSLARRAASRLFSSLPVFATSRGATAAWRTFSGRQPHDQRVSSWVGVTVVFAAAALSYLTLAEGKTSSTVDWLFGAAGWVIVVIVPITTITAAMRRTTWTGLLSTAADGLDCVEMTVVPDHFSVLTLAEGVLLSPRPDASPSEDEGLAAVVVPRFTSRTEQAKNTAAATDISVMEGAIDAFQVDTGRFPTNDEGLSALVQMPGNVKNWQGPYIKKGSDSRSIESEEQLLTITLEEALAVFAQPKQRGRGTGATAPPLKELGDDPVSKKPIVLKEGRFGPYVTDGETNASLRKGDSVESITPERAHELLADRRAAGPPKKKAKKAAKARR